MFVTFEGIGGAGKTTQVELVGRILEREGRDVVTAREPGTTAVGERLRERLLHGAEIPAWEEAELFAEARARLVHEVIAPALRQGADVLCDRYIDSSLAYQGAFRGLGIDAILDLNLRATDGLLPDRTFLLLIDVDEARRRRQKVDRIEAADRERLVKLDRAYREIAALFPERVIPIETMQSPEETAQSIREQLRDLS